MAGKIVSRETPLAQLTLRKYEHPRNIRGRGLLKKICLSLGMLQPGDSRDVIVDVLDVLVNASREKKALEIKAIQLEVIERRKKQQLPVLGITRANIGRQLRRLREIFFAEKIANTYRITEFASLDELFAEKIQNFLLPSVITRIREHLSLLET